MNLAYLVIELKRLARNKRVLIFSMALPAGLLAVLGNVYGDGAVNGASAQAYLMVSMAIMGVMANALGGGGSIAVERGLGWNRQLRLTPLSPLSYLLTKVLLAVVAATGPLLVTFVVGRVVLGIDLSLGTWAQLAGLVLASSLPFAALGVAFGYLVKAESVQQMVGLTNMALGLLGGLWIPVQAGFMKTIAQLTPTYWAADLARGPLFHGHPSLRAVLVMCAWTAGLGLLAYRRFQVSTARA
jgi:ABC-2 type transport system permease protein